MAYRPELKDIVMIKHSNTLAEVKKIHNQNEITVEILRCHVKDREGEQYFTLNKMVRLIWRRISN